MGCKVVQGFKEVGKMLADSIVCVVGGRVPAQRERGLQRGLVVVKDFEGGADAGPRGSVHDLRGNLWMTITERPQHRPQSICVERLH